MNKLSSWKSLLIRINQFAFLKVGMKKLVITSTIFIVLVAVIPTGTSYFFSLILNKLIGDAQNKSIAAVSVLAYLYVIMQVVPFLIRNINGRISSRMNLFLGQHFNILYEQKMANLDYAYFDNSSFYDRIKSVKEKGVVTTFALFMMQFESLEVVVQIILASAAISLIGFKYVMVLVVTTLPMIIIEAWKRKSRKAIYEENRTSNRYASVYLGEAGSRESRVFNLNDVYIDKYQSITDSVINRLITFEDKRVIIDIATYVFFGLGLLYVIHQTFLQIAQGVILAGSAVFIINSVLMFTFTLRAIIALLATFYENKLYAEEFFEIMDLPPMIVKNPLAQNITFDQGPEIVFENVSFRYPEKESYALENISLKIPSGNKVAFVGENGGGKSTMIKLLLRFYDPTEGRILVNGTDLKDLNVDRYRELIGYVAQSPSMPNLVIREILSHRNDLVVNDNLIHAALERSRAYDFVKKYEQGIEQQLGKMFKGGVAPSDGQRQRLAISRAYAKQPQFLIFDEPTADLDPETQNHVFDDFYGNNQGVTGILVVHSLQGVMAADTVYVFENSTISQTGTHAELLLQEGWYGNSFKKQFKNIHSL
jgi:ATP-binding cassette subfamily B protein